MQSIKKKVLIIGNGGREHALAWKMKQSSSVGKIYCAPGNGGTATLGENIPIKPTEIEKLVQFAKEKEIDLTVVGPEIPLSMGIVNRFQKEQLPIFGPSKEASEIESSKIWTRRFLKKINVPSPEFKVFSDYKKALSYGNNLSSCVVKADGLAQGKGVFICKDKKSIQDALKKIMIEKVFGEAGKRIVIEELLIGKEVSVIAFCDGKQFAFLVPARDYKRARDSDRGLNTGGMGCYAPADHLTKKQLDVVANTIVKPVLHHMKKMGRVYKGALYAGLMVTKKGIKVLEFNCRFGDPETQVQMPLLKNDLFDIMMSCINGDLSKTPVKFFKKACVSVVVCSKGYPQKYKTGFEISGLTEKFPKDILIIHAGTKKVTNKIITDGGRVINVVAVDDNISQARKKVYHIINHKISFAGMVYRNDIALL
jgi:phosphoribosylamine--glycine ligase